ncbi:MAG: aspartate ammonia-lyase [Verrucomicrobiota bacterium]|jgi:aspartate ammonia-lyase|nr:aspartate ammonia-lyase [Verrucomicrobiota bacterium]
MPDRQQSTRVERDTLGARDVPAGALYGIHTQRALENFDVSGRRVRPELIRAVVTVKKACALTHKELGALPDDVADALVAACDDVLAGRYGEAFVTDALQGGAGTSTNMNVNEVLANLALLKLGGSPGDTARVNPLDHVNRGQSTNDVYPTALRIAAIARVRGLADALALLQEALQRKEQAFAEIRKLGRTQLMDAAPVTLGETFGAYAQAIARDRWRIYKVEERLRQLNLGGTAVGTGAAADRRYVFRVTEVLRELTGYGLARAEYPMDLTQNNDVFVEVSGLLKACAVNLLKLSNDLRLMASGPRGGLGEIRLEPRQVGSSIMPGKVNPVIPECVAQCAMQVIANDTAITLAAASGQLELNAFMPLIADALLDSLALLSRAVERFRTACIDTLEADRAACARHLHASTAPALLLVPLLGYDAAAALAEEALASGTSIRQLVRDKGLLPPDAAARLFVGSDD